MSTTLHSFMDIFETEFEAGEEIVQLQKMQFPLFSAIMHKLVWTAMLIV